jgi:uncharacterized protein YecE (DUF72 family)
MQLFPEERAQAWSPGALRWGTSSWSEASWVGPFYPPGTKPADFLSHYSRRYGTVEADVTYYRVPTRSMVEGWERKTPPGFCLCAKFPRQVVHGGQGPTPDAQTLLRHEAVGGVVQEFLGAMGCMGPKLGPLVLQLPYLGRSIFRGPDEFLERLDAFLAGLPPGGRYAVEVRNREWIAEPLLTLLRRHRAAFVLVDLVYMPHPADLPETLDLITADFLYARLIGDRKRIDSLTRTFGSIVLDQGPRLERWAALLRRLAPTVRESFVYANNHYAGHGPATIDQLAALLGEVPPLPDRL